MLRQLLLVLLVLPFCALANDWYVEEADRVVAISDVHGAYDAMVATLTNVGILDDTLSWSGGNARLVIVGDLLDRGPRSRDVMDLLMRLEGEAIAAGGYVHVLFGNHESMNMIGDMRYVSKAEYAAFADDETQEQRDRWFKPWTEREGGKKSDSQERFDQLFPPGYFALRAAFGPEGKYGKWLLEKSIVAVIDGTAYVHGGLSPMVAELGLDGVNQDLIEELASYVKAVDVLMEAEVLLPTDSYYDHDAIVRRYAPFLGDPKEVREAIRVVKSLVDAPVFASDGPLWFRGNIACGGLIEEQRLNETLQAIGATRVVVGHTPTPNRRVMERFDGRVIEVDTGMLNAYYRGTGNALVIENGELRVYEQSGAEPYAPIAQERRVGRRPGNLSAEDLEVLLENGEIVSQSEDETGRSLVQVSDGTNTVTAIFSKRQSKGFYPDVAAYRLDRLLSLDMVPVTTMRKVGRSEGSLQFFPDKLMDEGQRSQSGRGSSARCPLPWQWDAMYAFDVLIYNEGRSLQRMLYDPSQWSLILVQHDLAFKNAKGRPRHLKNIPIEITDGWQVALTELDDDVLAEQFADVLDSRRLKALGDRRDQLLAK